MTIEEQDRMVEAQRGSGKTVAQWSKENNINAKTLTNYSYQYNQRHGFPKKKEMRESIVELIPVKTKTSGITVRVRNCCIDVNEQTDVTLLKKVVQVLADD